MNKRLYLLLVLASFCLASCYSVTQVTSRPRTVKNGGVFYALPQTELSLDVTLYYYDLEGATYSEYAAEMLALDDFDVERPYTIQDVALTSRVLPDPDHFYLVSPRGISVQVDSRHLLRAVGMNPQEAAEVAALGKSVNEESGEFKLDLRAPKLGSLRPKFNLYDHTDTFYVRGDRPGNPTMALSKKGVRTMRQRAQAAAEELDKLQEQRDEIAVSDRLTSEAKAAMLQDIEEREALIISQFIGTPKTQTLHFDFVPQAISEHGDSISQQFVLFYFSPVEGVCDSDDVAAVPVVCTLKSAEELNRVQRFARFRTVKARQSRLSSYNNNFKYRLTTQAQVELSCEYFDYSMTLPIAQFGPIIDLPHKRFKALFNEKTGALIYYEN